VSDALQADETVLRACQELEQPALQSEILAHAALASAMKGDSKEALERI